MFCMLEKAMCTTDGKWCMKEKICDPAHGGLSVDMFLSNGPVGSIVFKTEMHSKNWFVNDTRREERMENEQ